MRLPFMKMCCLAMLPAMVTGVSVAAPSGTELVENAARRWLEELAQRHALQEPLLTLRVVPPTGRTPKTCATPPEISALDTRQISRMRFALACTSGNWREEYLVRGALSARVLVAATRIEARRPLTEDDVKLERRDLPNPAETVADVEELAGQASRRALQPGQVINRRTLAPALLVRRGANVRIMARNGNIAVAAAGQAVDNGHQGETISVRNLTSGKLIRARVVGIDEVEPADAMPQSP
ncbi:flagellar basal body P-ring formation chaperone FlgA [Candidatus Dactylopiibacterium carminicum]|nr:flagellar basal body P-ring formation chaperone FlgA [Candidatus Dactylopiibacterium carminicum]